MATMTMYGIPYAYNIFQFEQKEPKDSSMSVLAVCLCACDTNGYAHTHTHNQLDSKDNTIIMHTLLAKYQRKTI